LNIILSPIAWVRSSETAQREDYWGGIVSDIVLDAGRFTPEALTGLSDFSHVEVLFHLHGVQATSVVTGQRHPRGNQDWPEVGIFAQRAKARPNRIAASVCRILSIRDLTISVQGLDAFDGSPVLDIKPVMKEFLPERAAVRQPSWASTLMSHYFELEKT